MKKIEILKGERWVQYKDTSYYVSSEGRIKRVYKHTEHLLTTFYKPRLKSYVVKINGKDQLAHRVIYEAFYGPIPKDVCVYHRNHIINDNALINLRLISRHDLGKLVGKRNNRNKKILDVETGNVYNTINQAAKALYIANSTVYRYCEGQTKKPLRKLKWIEW